MGLVHLLLVVCRGCWPRCSHFCLQLGNRLCILGSNRWRDLRWGSYHQPNIISIFKKLRLWDRCFEAWEMKNRNNDKKFWYLLQSLYMLASFQHFEQHFHWVEIQSVFVDGDWCWLFCTFVLIFETASCIFWVVQILIWLKYWYFENWVGFDIINLAQKVRICIKLTDWFVFFHVDRICIDRIAFVIGPNIWWGNTCHFLLLKFIFKN